MGNNCQIYDINDIKNRDTIKIILSKKLVSRIGKNKLTINDYVQLVRTTMSGLDIDLDKFENNEKKKEVVDGILDISSTLINKFGNILNKILIGSSEDATNALRVNLNKELVQNDSKTEVENATDDSVINESSIDYTSLGKLYKSNAIINYIQSKFGSDIFRKCFLETNSLSDINSQISNYKIDLFNSVVDYLNSQSMTTYEKAETIDDLSSDNYDDVMFEMNDLANSISSSVLSRLYTDETKNPLFISLNCFSTLLYFDDFLKNTYKKMFSKDENGIYSISFGSNIIKDFRTNENVDAIQEMGSLIGVLSNNIPWLFKTGNSFINIDGRTLDSTKTILTLNKILNTMSNINEYSNLKTFENGIVYNALLKFHENPVKNLKIILNNFDNEILSGKQGRNFLNIIDKEIIHSLYEFLYNEENGIYTISKNRKNNTKNATIYDSFDLVDIVAASADRSNEVTYSELVWDNGKYSLNKISKSNIDTPNLQLIGEINATNIKRSINSYDDLSKKYNIKWNYDNSSVSVFFTTDDGIYEFTFGGYNLEKIFIYKNGERIKNNEIKFLSPNEIKKNIESNKLDIGSAILKFVDDFTNIGFISDNCDLFSVYYSLQSGGTLSMDYILNLASSGLLVSDIYNAYNKSGSDEPILQFIANNKENHNLWLSHIKVLDIEKVTQKSGLLLDLVTVLSNYTPGMKRLTMAKLLQSGDAYKYTTRGKEGNDLPNSRIANLVNQVYYQAGKAKKILNSPLNKNILVKNELIEGVHIPRVVVNPIGEQKLYSDLSSSELMEMNILHNFWNSILKNNKVSIQPTTISDKSTIPLYECNLNKEISLGRDLGFEKLISYKSNEILEGYRITMRDYYKQINDNIINDYNKIYTGDFLNMISERAGLNIEKININKSLNKLLNYTTFEELVGQVHRINKTLLINEKINFTEVLHYQKNKKPTKLINGEFITGLSLNPLISHFVNLYTDEKLFNERMDLEKKSFVNCLLKDFNIDLSNKATKNTILESAKKIDGTITNEKYLNSWTIGDSLIIAKQVKFDNNGKTIEEINVTNSILSNIDGYTLVINPILDYYFSVDNLLSTNIKNLLLGSEIAHPGKNDNMRWREAEAQRSQYKRALALPATIQYFMRGTITSIPNQYKIATFSDPIGETYNIMGDKHMQDVWDGGGFVYGPMSILENKSLLDSASGDVKKPLWTGIDQKYGTGYLFKFATSAITNSLLRTSMGSKISLFDLHKRMSNQQFGDDINLCLDLHGNTTSLLDYLKGRELFIQLGSKNYRIDNLFKSDNDILNNSYTISYTEVDGGGNLLLDNDKPNTILKQVVINSLYDLHNILGGAYSSEIKGTKLVPTELSMKLVADYMNNVGSYKENDIYQPLKLLPISYIVPKSVTKVGCANLNNSNVLSAKDTELQYGIYDTDGLGIVLEPNHHSDESVLTEFSQVVTAAEGNGNTHYLAKELYRTIAEVVYSTLSPNMKSLNNYLINKATGNNISNKELYEMMGQIVVQDLKSSRNNSQIVNNLIAKIKESFEITDEESIRKEFNIPFSDNSLYKSVIIAYVSGVNGSAFKRKFAGTGNVIAPSHGIIQHYNLGGRKYAFNDILEKAIYDIDFKENVSGWNINKETNSREIDINILNLNTIESLDIYNRNLVNNYLSFLQNKEPNLDNSIIVPGDIIVDKLGNIINLDTINGYYEFKNSIVEGDTFKRCITQPSDLSPSRTSWTVTDNNGIQKAYNLFDTYFVKQSYYNEYNIPKNQLIKHIDNSNRLLSNGYMVIGIANEKSINIQEISGTKYEVVPIDYGSLKVEDAETVVSRMHASKMRLDNSSVQTILDKGPSYFFNNSLSLVSKVEEFSFAFSRENGKHDYFINEDVTSRIKNEQFTKTEKNIIWVIDKNGNKLYRMGKWIEDPTLEYDKNDDKYFRIVDNKKVFIAKSKIREAKDGTMYAFEYYAKPIQNPNRENVYIITEAGKRENVLYDFIKNNDYTNAIEGRTSPVKTLIDLNDKVNIKDSFLYNIVSSIKKGDTFKQSQDICKRQSSIANFAAFKTSLSLLSARIPAQDLQSFMKMKIVNFADTDQNVAYVSHWQLWLQGSDYDVDKANMMSFDFDKNGHFYGWSNKFKIDNEDNLLLPSPSGELIELKINGNDTSELSSLINYYKIVQEKDKIKTLSKILYYINNSDDNLFEVNTDEDTINRLNFEINEHNMYVIPDNKKQSVYKNIISARLQQISSDVSNIVKSSSPITFGDLRKIGDSSEIGKTQKELTSMNPATKFIMQEINQTGKSGIGVEAVAEKTFFTLLHYYNDAFESGDYDRLKNAMFNVGISIIKDSNGKLTPSNRFTLANTRIDNNIIINLESNFKTLISNWNKLSDDDKINKVKELIGTDDDQALAISALLSAATDNAKELLLAPINCVGNVSGVYGYLLMMGFNINDIANFMTNPAIIDINNLSKSNIFHIDDTLSINEAIDYVNNGPRPSKDFSMRNTYNDDNEKVNSAYSSFMFALMEKNKAFNEFKEDNPLLKFDNLICGFIKKCAMEDIKFSFDTDFNSHNVYLNKVDKFLSRFNGMSEKDRVSYFEHADSFKQIYPLSNEMKNLGSKFLHLNQGMESVPNEMILYLNGLEKAIISRINIFDAGAEAFIKNVKKNQYTNLNYSNEEIYDIRNNARSVGIKRNNFDIMKFLSDNEYKIAAINYYNLIKGSINILDVINKSPQFKALFDSVAMVINTQKSVIGKYKILMDTREALCKTDPKARDMTINQLNGIESYISNMLILEWIKSLDLNIVLPPGSVYFERGVNRKILKDKEYKKLDLTTEEDIASFKYWFENDFLDQLKRNKVKVNTMFKSLGTYVTGVTDKYRTNKIDFIKASRVWGYKKDGFIKHAIRTDITDGKMSRNDELKLERYKRSFAMANEKINGIAIKDWFILYNFVVNKNIAGGDRLTSIIDRALTKGNEPTFLDNYYDFIGKFDKTIDSNNLDLNIDDLLISGASFVNEKSIYSSNKKPTSKYIKYKDKNGILRYKIKSGNTYNDFPIVYYKKENEAKALNDYADYFTFIMPNKNKASRLVRIVQSEDETKENINYALRELIQSGVMHINITCE